MGDDLKQHCDRVYHDRAPDQVSWYQPRLDFSLDLIRHTAVGLDEAAVDNGADAVYLGLRDATHARHLPGPHFDATRAPDGVDDQFAHAGRDPAEYPAPFRPSSGEDPAQALSSGQAIHPLRRYPHGPR
jgi:hypothetical protein